MAWRIPKASPPITVGGSVEASGGRVGQAARDRSPPITVGGSVEAAWSRSGLRRRSGCSPPITVGGSVEAGVSRSLPTPPAWLSADHRRRLR